MPAWPAQRANPADMHPPLTCTAPLLQTLSVCCCGRSAPGRRRSAGSCGTSGEQEWSGVLQPVRSSQLHLDSSGA